MIFDKKLKMKVFSIAQVALVFLLTIGIAGYFSFLGIDPHHDGIMLKPASDIAHGQMLFRDTFTQYGAFATILQSWAIAMFGNYLYVIKLLTVFFYGLIAVMLWLIWNLFLPELLATTACVIWLLLAPYHDPTYVFLPWSSVYSLLFQLVTLYTLLRFLQTKKNWWQVCAGVAASLTFLSRQPVGFFLFGSIIFYVLLMRFKKYKIPTFKPFFITFTIIQLIFISWLLVNNAFFDWFFQTIQYPAMWATSASSEKIVLLMNFVQNMFPNSYSPLSMWTLLPIFTLSLGIIYVAKRRLNAGQSLVLLAVCVCLASWAQYHPVSDPRHLYWAATPMIGFSLYLFRLSTNKKKSLIILIIFFLLFVPDVFYHLRLARRKIRMFSSYLTLAQPEVLRGMRVSPIEKRFFEEMTNEIDKTEKARPSKFIITTGIDGLYSLFDGKNINCYKLTVNWNWKLYNSQLENEYSKAMNLCINKYRPIIVTKNLLGLPNGYVLGAKGLMQRGNYLLIPQ